MAIQLLIVILNRQTADVSRTSEVCREIAGKDPLEVS